LNDFKFSEQAARKNRGGPNESPADEAGAPKKEKSTSKNRKMKAKK